MLKLFLRPCLVVGIVCLCAPVAVVSQQNYQKALQMSMYFYECQESGRLSPGNRCPWRAESFTTDGQDVGRDLSGGWFDAGDHWKANSTMGFSAMMLAWSAVNWPAAYTNSGQGDELVNNLKHVCDYFLKCVVDPHPDDTADFGGYEVYIDVGGKPGPEPGVHSVFASAEVVEGYTVREALKGDTVVGVSDVSGKMAAALAASAVAIRRLTGNAGAYEQRLLSVARKLAIYSDRYLPAFLSNSVKSDGCHAIDPSGSPRKIGYRNSFGYPAVIMGLLWVHKAELEFATSDYNNRFALDGRRVEETMLAAASDAHTWWKYPDDKFAGLLQLMYDESLPRTQTERILAGIETYARIWRDLSAGDKIMVSPGGLHYTGYSDDAFTLSHMLRAISLGCLLSAYDDTERARYLDSAQNQMGYVLGVNPTGKSYMIGFDGDGTRPYWRTVHHGNAYGAWKNFEHLSAGKPEYNVTNPRHTLYGGGLMGPVATNDSFPAVIGLWQYTEIALYVNAEATVVLSALLADGRGNGVPYPDNAFPPPVVKNTNTDPLTTDREFFVLAKTTASDERSIQVEAEMNNRTKWPARRTGGMSFRYFFGGARNDSSAYSATIVSSEVDAEVADVVWVNDTTGYFEVSFPGDTIGPFWMWNNTREWSFYRKVTFRIEHASGSGWDVGDDWSAAGLVSDSPRLLPHFPVYHDGMLVGGEEPVSTAIRMHDQQFEARSSYGPRIHMANGVLTVCARPHGERQWWLLGIDGRRLARAVGTAAGVTFALPPPGIYVLQSGAEVGHRAFRIVVR